MRRMKIKDRLLKLSSVGGFYGMDSCRGRGKQMTKEYVGYNWLPGRRKKKGKPKRI
jgi:hypothetical protein